MPATGRCCFCNALMFPAGSPEVRADPFCQQTREHMIPQSIDKKRLNVKANLRPSCHGCNDMKGDAPWQIYAWFVRQPGIMQMARPQRRQQFRSFVYACALAGFTAARRDVLKHRPPAIGIVAIAFAAQPPDDEPVWMRGRQRARSGRFAKKFTNGEHHP